MGNEGLQGSPTKNAIIVGVTVAGMGPHQFTDIQSINIYIYSIYVYNNPGVDRIWDDFNLSAEKK